MENVTDKSPSQFFVTENLWRKYSVTKIFVTEIVTDIFRHKKICDGNCDGKSVTISRGGIAPREVFCDGLGDVRHNFVTEWWESVTICDGKLWRNSVTIWFYDGIPSQIPSQTLEFNEKNLFETFTIFQLNATVQCNKIWFKYHNRCIERRANN